MGWKRKSKEIVTKPTSVASMHEVVGASVSRSQFYKQVSLKNAENENGIMNLKLLKGLCRICRLWMMDSWSREEDLSQ